MKQALGRAMLMASGVLACMAACHGAFAQPARGDDGLVIDHATVVDTHTGKLSADMTLVIKDGRIVSIGRGGKGAVGDKVKRIDAHGEYVVPGFNDMHAHLMDSIDPQGSYAMMLVNGVTGFRQMSGSPELLAGRAQQTLPHYDGAPEVLAMPGALLTFANAPTPQAARAEVDRQKTEGADFIKTISVSPPTFFAALDEANKVGLPYSGHLSPGVDAAKASEGGMRSIEHLGPTDTMLMSCSTDEAAIRAQLAEAAKAGPPKRLDLNSLPKGMGIAFATANPVLNQMMADPTLLPRIDHILDTYSEAKCHDLAMTFIAHDTWQVPTLIRLRRMLKGDDPQYVNDPNQRYLPPASRQLWKVVDHQFSDNVSPEARKTLDRLWQADLRLTKLLADSGVKMMAGSDVVAGFTLHQEFDLLAEAGLSPLKVLQMTTLDGAQYLGRTKTMGSVEVGKDANLVLLKANPIASVQNLHGVDGVVRAGAYYSRQDLDALASQTEQRMKTPAVAALPAPEDL